ncbi:hypothetical protein R1sor_021711 [Riccia sorocarpa]|uniref:Uncharacterized protein n=1 Tax=Riccia sorocarpa TaxID=122646 RepID=A0ABD3GKY1_9MARC
MTHDMGCIRFNLPTEDSSRRRCLSVEILYSSDLDLDEISSRGSSDEREFEKCAYELKRLGTVRNTRALEFTEDGFQVQTPFFPGKRFSIARGDEVFAVVSLPIHEDAFALKSVGKKMYLRCDGEGQLVRATCDEWSVSETECFMEEDAGGTSQRYDLLNNQFLGGGHPVKLFSKVEAHGKFQVLPVSQVF